MADTVQVCETFTSIQGESTFAGLVCFFIRLAGCNLRCSYCDTPQAYGPGRETPVDALVREARASGAPIVEITGGEPLLQPGFHALALALRDELWRPVLVETNGSQDLGVVPDRVIAVVDVKCPGSGAGGSFRSDNLQRLRPHDEVKFVIGDRADYDWARDFVMEQGLTTMCHAVLFAPVFGKLAPADLAAWISADRVPVRLQIQLQKVVGFR